MTLFEPGRIKTGGREKGVRNKFSNKFLEALATDFEVHGADAIKIVRIEKPAEYLKICAAIIPKSWDDDEALPQIAQTIRRVIVRWKDINPDRPQPEPCELMGEKVCS
jgi:hypothetical protein